MITPPLSPLTATRDNPMPLDALGERIAELAARIHAATYELLVMLREFDARGGVELGFPVVRRPATDRGTSRHGSTTTGCWCYAGS